MNPNRYDIWGVTKAAGKLSSHALTVGARHLSDGKGRLQFSREVAVYARRIVDDVQLGRKTPEQGVSELLQEQRSITNQSLAVNRVEPGALTYATKNTSVLHLTPFLPDPKRLFRFVHKQYLETPEQRALSASRRSVRPVPTKTYRRESPEDWPAAIELYAPGFYIVPKSTTVEALQAELFTSPTQAVIDKFRVLNPGLDQIKAGQMIVLSDPDNYKCSEEEARLMAAAETVNELLADLSPEEADFMARHRDEIETFLTRGSTSIGVGEAVFANNLKSVQSLLKGIEDLHTSSFQKHGHLRSAEFFAERKQLLNQLDSQLTSFTKKSIGFPDHPKLKTALGLSSRSFVYRWGQAGGARMPPGYATHLAGVTKAAKYLKYGGYVGIAIGGGASYMKVQDVCAAGDSAACEKVKYTEGGSFIGTVAGGAGIGALSAGAVSSICLAIGVPTALLGTVVCGVVVVGVGSFAGGTIGGMVIEGVGEKIYEATH
ncbi:hypothetical protein [Pseudomonas sp.]|uniref:hypothetical protein n=1 Tax=Pseudomonas sp. TaxID=306 RepID=UPI002620CCE8|nr:hypothetical protein [Pseudomonas sp.]